MTDLLEDRPAARKFWVACIILAFVGSLIAIFTSVSTIGPDKKKGAHRLIIRNHTLYDVTIYGDFFSPFSHEEKPFKLHVPAQGHVDYAHHGSKTVWIGYLGSQFSVKLKSSKNTGNIIKFLFPFNETDDRIVFKHIIMRKQWLNQAWVITIESEEE